MVISYPILAALLASLLAQVIKIPLHYIRKREWKFELLFSTGGMPSSHTATVVSLTTAMAMTEGIQSNAFAISLILTIIVMHDATGVRRQAGQHAVALNQMAKDFQQLVGTLKHHNLNNYEKREQLKELLGHKPLEVFFGALFGLIVGLILYSFYPFPKA
ncbi:divergent PAP2 family protein [Virgibacillus sp. MSP4-1]|uniref:divergent PAP2 family protein n=1 Tax=Virgibacillus sp. MSP4-1 TaxID=2700081 RepID=UPI0003A37D95|nr:divergent PAP2 family protein [Virgibacillus sp. MSP4-1]QHS22100.1 divergent PAP2 family protein [Virgibacillus sp. MSP4-1]